MKLIKTITILLTITLAFTTVNTNSKDHFQSEANFNKEDLYQTWFAKQILINGKPDPDNFPVNNDELTLNKDFSMVTVDKTFNVTDKGKWKWISNDIFEVTGETGPAKFKILELTKTKLRTKLISNEVNMEIIYSNKK